MTNLITPTPAFIATLREVTVVPYPGDTTPESFVERAAWNVENKYLVGGSNVRAMVIRALDLFADHAAPDVARQLRRECAAIEGRAHEPTAKGRALVARALREAAALLHETEPVEWVQDAIARVRRAGLASTEEGAAQLVEARATRLAPGFVLSSGVDDLIRESTITAPVG